MGIEEKSSVFMHTRRSLNNAVIFSINITKLESRPIQGEPWNYMFYIDMEGDTESNSPGAFHKNLQEKTAYIKISGRN